MELLLTRFKEGDNFTIGQLSVDGDDQCFTLEDKDRHLEKVPLIQYHEVKVQNQTAIPRGRFQIDLRESPHLQETVPWLRDVPGFKWVYIHQGNTDKDTDGCILVGDNWADDWVSNSRATFAKLFNKIVAAINRGDEVWITIK